MHVFGTKAETLEFLFQHQKEIGAGVLPLRYFSAGQWREKPGDIWQEVDDGLPVSPRLIVRSSAKGEDGEDLSQAGKYESVLCDRSEEEFRKAAEAVLASYGEAEDDDQFLVQPVLEEVEGAGVAFTVDPNSGGCYYVINYDMTGSTSSITSGQGRENKLFYCFKKCPPRGGKYLKKLYSVLGALEKLLGTERLDVEFAFRKGEVYLFQVRPLCVKSEVADAGVQDKCIRRIQDYIQSANAPKPFLYGEGTLYSNMTDWNPAEMIGVHPRNLALSLYKELITDNTWAYQRDNYGYLRLRSFPLMVDFCGMPYIDVRVSFNSFVPADLSPAIAEKLVNYYLGELSRHPEEHDKVEFDIIFSCYTFDLPRRVRVLREYGFTSEEVEELITSLRKLTNRIINSRTGLWRGDEEKIRILKKRYREIVESDLDEVGKMYWLIEDCKRYGTLPFAGLARAGFIAVQLLQSMVKEGILSREEYDDFMREVATVGSRMREDFSQLTPEAFIRRYGHLRPGTYDITSARYDEKPELYFHWQEQSGEEREKEGSFRLSLPQLGRIRSALEEHGLDDDVLGLFTFIRSAIEGREMAKFVFTKNLSETLRLFGIWCGRYGVSLEDSAYGDIQIVKEAYGTTPDAGELIRQSVGAGKRKYEESRHLVLPPLIAEARDAAQFYIPDSQPNYVTQGKAHGRTVLVEGKPGLELDGCILLIPAADPGYDWIFSHNIAGFITEYGGANSHMAIRAGELGIPAVIGAGQKLFDKAAQAQVVEIDASLQKVTVLQ